MVSLQGIDSMDVEINIRFIYIVSIMMLWRIIIDQINNPNLTLERILALSRNRVHSRYSLSVINILDGEPKVPP